MTFPFAAAYINSTLQAAMATFQVPGAANELKAVGLSPTVTGQFRIKDVGFELGAGLQEIFGSDSYSAYVLGAELNYAFTARIRYEAIRADNWVITPAFYVSTESGFDSSPLSAANLAITSPSQAIGSDLLSRSTTREARPELLGAYAISPAVGMTGELGFGIERSTASGSANTDLARLGVAIDGNLQAGFGLPVGGAIFFTDEIPFASGLTATPILGSGVYEMFNKKFNFGVEWARLMSSSPSIELSLTLTAYY